MPPRVQAALVAVAAVAVLGGGVAAWLAKGSVMSLVAAGTVGLAWLACVPGLVRGARGARVAAQVVAAVLVAGMAWRWVASGSPTVALPVIALAVAIVALVRLPPTARGSGAAP